jgi:hypothetical protein
LQIFTSGRLDVYLLVPMLWAVYNAIPPVLFFVYFFTKGRLLKGLCSFAQVFGLVLAAGERHFHVLYNMSYTMLQHCVQIQCQDRRREGAAVCAVVVMADVGSMCK